MSAVAVGGFLAGGLTWMHAALETTPPIVQSLDILNLWVDGAPVTVVYVVYGQQVPWSTTADNLRSNRTLWHHMHLAEWNSVPEALRCEGLESDARTAPRPADESACLGHHAAARWDRVPQPMRTLAYRQMIAFWSGYATSVARTGLPPRLVADTLSAIVMTESWFDHRGYYVNRDGSRDVGLGGASAYTRTRLRQLYAEGFLDVELTDDAYDNPWMATRFVALWMSLMLDEAGGNLDLAVRAYNGGWATLRTAAATPTSRQSAGG